MEEKSLLNGIYNKISEVWVWMWGCVSIVILTSGKNLFDYSRHINPIPHYLPMICFICNMLNYISPSDLPLGLFYFA